MFEHPAESATKPPTKAELEQLKKDRLAKRRLTDRQIEILAVIVCDAASKVQTPHASQPCPFDERDGTLLIEGTHVPVTPAWSLKMPWMKHPTRADAVTCCQLFAGREGSFYAVERIHDRVTNSDQLWLVRRVSVRAAIRFITLAHSLNVQLSDGIIAATREPEFEFMPLVPSGAKSKRQRKAKAAHSVAAVQLELATALVAVVKNFAAKPGVETLAEARRKVTALHQSLHAEETFKLAANG